MVVIRLLKNHAYGDRTGYVSAVNTVLVAIQSSGLRPEKTKRLLRESFFYGKFQLIEYGRDFGVLALAIPE
jgi:hypothetical protein